jgi:murein L,D-transpeptidase YafK
VRRCLARIIVAFALLSAADGVYQRRPPSVASASSYPSGLLNYNKPIARLLDLSRLDKDTVIFRIEKSRYRLTVFVKRKAIKAYPVVFGSNPVDDKRREGDVCTPEGTFRIRALYPHRRWSKFLWLDYPTRDSWRKFQEAKRSGQIGPQATVGSEIGLHGVPAGQDALIDARVNWTLGCISLKTADIAEIYLLAKAGTRVEIIR